MMKIKQIHISLFLAFLLTIPAGFLTPIAKSSSVNLVTKVFSLASVRPQAPVVSVINNIAKPFLAISETQSQKSFTTCQQNTKPGDSLVQNPSLINLNQPSDCFNLKLTKTFVVAEKLAVRPLVVASTKVLVVVNVALITSPNFLPLPIEQEVKVLPITAQLTELSFVYAKTTIFSNRISQFYYLAKPSLTIEELKVMRC